MNIVYNSTVRAAITQAEKFMFIEYWGVGRLEGFETVAPANESHRRTGQFFLGGLSHLCRKNFSTAPEKNCYANLQGWLTCNITLHDSPHPVIISNNPGFRALYLSRQTEFRFFV